MSLLYYLSQRGDWVSRSELAFLYRPDTDDFTALSNVRKLIHRAREYPWADTLEAEKARVRFLIETDVQAFRQAVTRRRWSEALDLYQGPFLDGVRLADVPGFEAWLELERADLARLWQQAAQQHARDLEQQQDWGGATRVLEALLKHDPLEEESLQTYLRALNAQGQRKQALEVFDHFCQTLKRELDAEPLETTRALMDGIRGHPRLEAAGSKQIASRSGRAAAQAAAERHNLPAPTTRFIGRKRELERLNERLTQPDVRLVTLIGLGGSGKTRLALELAWRQLDTFTHGVWFVSLTGADHAGLIVPAIANALGLSFSGPREPKQQLVDALREKTIMVVLDNFEHVLDAVSVVQELLEGAPGLKILVTSRVALELSGEWLFDVDGLACPPADTREALEAFDAVRLFLNRAERVSSVFVPTRETLQSVAEICRKVEGLPLALELAATWTRSLSVSQIAQQLQTGLDLLSTRQRDVPERQRSIRTVLLHSWADLSPPEQTALSRLSVFRGTFTLPAAHQVAGAHFAILLGLMNRSLVRRNADERFVLHELVREFASTQLEPQTHASLEGSFSQYYLSLTAEIERGSFGSRRTLMTIEANNIRAACGLAVTRQDWAALEAALDGMGSFWLETETLETARRFFESLQAASRTAGRVQLEARALGWLGKLQRKIGAFKEAQSSLMAAVITLRASGLHEDLVRCLNEQGLVARELGDPQRAETYLLEALERTGSDPSHHEHTDALFNLALLRRDAGAVEAASKLLRRCLELREAAGQVGGAAIALAQLATTESDPDKRRTHTEQAATIFRQVGDQRNLAVVLNNLATIAYNEGNLAGCERLLLESLELKQHLGDLKGQVTTLSNLAAVVRDVSRFDDARAYLERAQALAERNAMFVQVVNVLGNLGETARQAGDAPTGRAHLLRAVRLASTAEVPARILLVVLSYTARLLEDESAVPEARSLARLITDHPATPAEIRHVMHELSDRWQTPALDLPDSDFGSLHEMLSWLTPILESVQGSAARTQPLDSGVEPSRANRNQN